MPKPLKYEQIVIGGAVKALTPPSGDTAYSALIQAEAQLIRWRDDGSNPTAAVGMRLPVDNILEYDGDLTKIRFMEAVAGGVLNVTYYGV